MVKRVTEKRTSYNVYLVNGSERFLCNNRPVEQAKQYAEGLQRTLTPGIQVI
jgi:hypothetical protein